jgi:hypothetical protein
MALQYRPIPTGLIYRCLMSAVLLAAPLTSWTQSGQDTSGSSPLGADWEGVLVALIFWLGIGGIMLITVVDDAKARGMDSVVSPVLLVLFLGWIGLYLYKKSRPQGDLVECPGCDKMRLAGDFPCPRCGYSGPSTQLGRR